LAARRFVLAGAPRAAGGTPGRLGPPSARVSRRALSASGRGRAGGALGRRAARFFAGACTPRAGLYSALMEHQKVPLRSALVPG